MMLFMMLEHLVFMGLLTAYLLTVVQENQVRHHTSVPGACSSCRA